MSWFELNCFPLQSWLDSNKYFQKMIESVVESKRFRGKHLSLEFIWFIPRKIYLSYKLKKKHYFNRISRHSAGHGSSFEKGQSSTIKVKSMSSIHTSQSRIMRRFRIDVFRLSHKLIWIISCETHMSRELNWINFLGIHSNIRSWLDPKLGQGKLIRFK